MRTIPIPAVLLCLLTPLLALAQSTGIEPVGNRQVTSSPLFWYWVVALSIAAVVFIWAVVAISRRRGPPYRRRIS